MSGVLGDDAVMKLLDYGELVLLSVLLQLLNSSDKINRVGSTMAANPPGCAAALAAMDVLEDENLSSRASEMGALMISTIKSCNPPHVKEYMGAGLLWAMVMEEKPPLVTSRRLAALLATRGVLANGIKGGRVRLCPPLNIDRELLIKGSKIVVQALFDLDTVPEGLPGETLPFQYGDFLR
jgi:ornithine--oxo-acid transaminase